MKQLCAPMLLSLAACGSPQEAVVQYHRALAQGDGAEALKRLSLETRAALASRAKQASEATAGAVPPDPAVMITQGPTALYPGPTSASEVTVLEVRGDRAKIRAEVGGAPAEMDLIREGGRWHLVLPLSETPRGSS